MSINENPFAAPIEMRDPARRLRGRLVAPVTVWTAGAGERRVGLTISSVFVAEGEPASVLGLVNPMSDLWDVLQETGAFVVHVLERGHRALAQRFAGTMPAPGGPFIGEGVAESRWGPVLTDVVSRAGCHILDAFDIGYHRLVRGAVEDMSLGETIDPLVYLQGHFRGLVTRDAP